MGVPCRTRFWLFRPPLSRSKSQTEAWKRGKRTPAHRTAAVGFCEGPPRPGGIPDPSTLPFEPSLQAAISDTCTRIRAAQCVGHTGKSGTFILIPQESQAHRPSFPCPLEACSIRSQSSRFLADGCWADKKTVTRANVWRWNPLETDSGAWIRV